MTSHLQAAASALVAFAAVPWAAFVGLFLYVVLLSLVAVGGDQLSDGFMAAAYGAPVAVYAAVLLVRGVRAVAALPARFGPMAPRYALPQ